MKKSRFTDEQVTCVLGELDKGASVVVRSTRYTHLVILGLALAATVTAGASASQFRSVTACQARIAQNQATLKQLQSGQAPKPVFLDIVKNADGSVKTMNQSDAVHYCASQGAHLPSARELAQLSTSLGAKGIVDACGSSDISCYSVKATNADGNEDSFEFSYDGYQRPAGEMGNNWFWSSSAYLNVSDFAFFLNGSGGEVAYVYRNGHYAVRCVIDIRF